MTTGRCFAATVSTGLVDEELHPVEFQQQVVGELDVGLVDLVDQHHGLLIGLEGVPQLAAHDVVADVMHARIAKLPVAQAGDRVVFVKPLLRLGGGLDVPLDQRHAQGLGDFMGQHGLAGAGFALDQQRPLQGDGGVDGDFEVAGGDIAVGALEAGHAIVPFRTDARLSGGRRADARRTRPPVFSATRETGRRVRPRCPPPAPAADGRGSCRTPSRRSSWSRHRCSPRACSA